MLAPFLECVALLFGIVACWRLHLRGRPGRWRLAIAGAVGVILVNLASLAIQLLWMLPITNTRFIDWTGSIPAEFWSGINLLYLVALATFLIAVATGLKHLAAPPPG